MSLEKDMVDYISYGYPSLNIIVSKSRMYSSYELPDMVLFAIENAPIKDMERINALNEALSSNRGGYHAFMNSSRYRYGISNMYLSMAERYNGKNKR